MKTHTVGRNHFPSIANRSIRVAIRMSKKASLKLLFHLTHTFTADSAASGSLRDEWIQSTAKLFIDSILTDDTKINIK